MAHHLSTICDTLSARALSAYWKNPIADAPAPSDKAHLWEFENSEHRTRYLVLWTLSHTEQNERWHLVAVFRIRYDGVLKRLKRWPTAINEYYA